MVTGYMLLLERRTVLSFDPYQTDISQGGKNRRSSADDDISGIGLRSLPRGGSRPDGQTAMDQDDIHVVCVPEGLDHFLGPIDLTGNDQDAALAIKQFAGSMDK